MSRKGYKISETFEAIGFVTSILLSVGAIVFAVWTVLTVYESASNIKNINNNIFHINHAIDALEMNRNKCGVK